MDTILFVDTLINLLAGLCALLAAAAVIFLVVRPLMDPRWNDGREASEDSGSPADARRAVRDSTMRGRSAKDQRVA